MVGQVNQKTTIKGYLDMNFTLNAMYLLDGRPDEVDIDFDLNIINPGYLHADFPLQIYAQDLGLYYEEHWVGHTSPSEISVGPGITRNRVNGTLVRTQDNEVHIAAFLSRYMLGEDINVFIRGTAKVDVGLGNSTDNPAVVDLQWLLPGIKDAILQDVSCPLDEVSPIRLILAAEGKMYNPLEFPIDVYHATFDAYVGHPCNRTLGRIDEDYPTPFYLPSKEPVCLTGLEMKVTLEDVACMTAGAVTGLELTALNGALEVGVEEFVIEIPFEYGPVEGRIGKCRV